jgi:hypothetical protein
MKKLFVLGVLAAAMLWSACSSKKGAYVDLRSGEKIEVEKDPVTGVWLNADTKEPVYLYVDTKKNDTLYGETGEVVNGHVVLSGNKYWYDADLEKENKVVVSDDYKTKVEDDGDVKIKDGDTKIKIDGETGEKKVKND